MNPKRTPVSFKAYTIPGTTVLLDRLEHFDHQLVPAIEPGYIFRQDLVEEVGYCITSGENCLLVGDTGLGKSSLVVQLAAHLNRPLRRMNLHGESDTTVLLGRDYPGINSDGTRCMEYREGPLVEAVRRGYWFLIDEIDAALQPVLFVLQQLLEDGGKLVIEDTQGTVVTPHPHFRLFATGNSVGIAGQHKLLYSGTMSRMNEATLDRFGVVIHVEQMQEASERDVIKRAVPNLDDDFIAGIIKIANEVRKNLQNDRLTSTFSTRRCIQWARAMMVFHPLRAAKMTILNKLGTEDYKVIEGVVQRFFGES